MRIEYTRQSLSDLRKIAADSRAFGDQVAYAVELRILRVIANIAQHPKAAASVPERPGMRVVPLVRYPYKIFYRVLDDRVKILHIRHTARKPWTRKGR
jgi:plasmid stabilization system protein ParE